MSFRHTLDAINVSTSVATLIVAVIGFSYTYKQISRTEQTLRASNTYSIQKDARELADNLYTDGSFEKAIESGFENSPVGQLGLWKIMNFYVAVYRQDAIGGLSESFSESMRTDFCGLMSNRNVVKGLSSMKERLDKDQLKMLKEWCGIDV